MTPIDDRLSAGLSADDAAFLKELEDGRGLFTQLGATFEGPLRFWTMLVFVFTLGFTVLGVVAVFQLLASERMSAIVLWASALWFSLIAVSMLKMWLFMRMNHLAVLRELKKIELRLVQLER